MMLVTQIMVVIVMYLHQLNNYSFTVPSINQMLEIYSSNHFNMLKSYTMKILLLPCLGFY